MASTREASPPPPPRPADIDGVDFDRLGDVLEVLAPALAEGQAQSVFDLIEHLARDANAAPVGNGFQARGDVDPVTEYVVAVDDNVADINAHAKFDFLVRRHVAIAFAHAALDFNGATQGVHDARKLDQHAIAGGLDDVAAVLVELGLGEVVQTGLQSAQRAFLVASHQPAVAGHIHGQDGGEAPLDSFAGQFYRP